MPRHRRPSHNFLADRPRCRLQVLLALVALASIAQAADDRAALTSQAQQFLETKAADPGRQVSVEVQPPPAQLPPCTDPQLFLPHPDQRLRGRVIVGVNCLEAGTRYLQAVVTIRAEHVVTRRALAAGEILSADMLELRFDDLSRLPRKTILELDRAIGRELTRPLPQGSAVPSSALRLVPLVARGARVRLEARASGFVASREGTALDSGGLNEEVRVRTESGEIIRARVSSRNLLTVEF